MLPVPLPLCACQIFDGPNVHAIPLGTFCGVSLPDPVRSSGSVVTLEFKSDTVVNGRGFLVEWTAVQSTGPIPTIAPGREIYIACIEKRGYTFYMNMGEYRVLLTCRVLLLIGIVS